MFVIKTLAWGLLYSRSSVQTQICRSFLMTATDRLFRSRNQAVAKSFFRHLKSEGFTNEQIIELSTTLRVSLHLIKL